LSEAKRAVERHLIASGIPFTILQASYFTEVWLTPMLGFDYAAGKARIYGNGNNKISWVSFKDVAEISVASLDQRDARNVVLNVSGPQALSPREVVRTFEAAGVEITEEFIAAEQWRAQMEAAAHRL